MDCAQMLEELPGVVLVLIIMLVVFSIDPADSEDRQNIRKWLGK